MDRMIVGGLCLSLAAASAWAQTDGASTAVGQQAVASGAASAASVAEAETVEAVPEQIRIVGQRPGPGLWKISKGDHVLWVFGTYTPLPKNMEWRSQQVETILAQSQEYLSPPSAAVHVGFFRSLTLLPYAIGLKKNPDGATLHDVLPADVYARWLPLKHKYLGNDDGVERERPLFAADDLYNKGLDAAGLTGGREVQKAIEKIVNDKHIKTTPTDIELTVDDPVATIKDFKSSSLDDVACFSKTLDRLESDIDAMRVRAAAWATGDLAGIEKLSYADRDAACRSAMNNGAFFKGHADFSTTPARMQEAWLASAEKSLATNTTTFAVLPLRLILDPSGYVTTLQAKGYQIDKPE